MNYTTDRASYDLSRHGTLNFVDKASRIQPWIAIRRPRKFISLRYVCGAAYRIINKYLYNNVNIAGPPSSALYSSRDHFQQYLTKFT